MNLGLPSAWVALFLLGAYHGINPAMGWLFAVALGMQKKSSRAVWLSLLPIATGHGAAIGLVVAAGVLAEAALPMKYLKLVVACILFAFGLYRLFRRAHPRGAGMQVEFRDLSIWSFLMASAHGAGFMLLPVFLGMSTMASAPGPHVSGLLPPIASSPAPWIGLIAVIVHTTGYLLVTGLVAFVVYEKAGLSLLRKAWVNLDLIWALALMATAVLTILIPA